MSRRSPLIIAGTLLGALLGSSAMVPLAASADPAAATVPDASGIKPVAPAASDATKTASTPNDAAKGATKTTGSDDATDKVSAKDMEARRRAQHQADREAYFSAHLAALHAGLALQPDQQSLWAPVETAIRDLAKARADRWRMHHEEMTSAEGGMSSGKTASDKGPSDASSSDKPGDAQRPDAVDKLLARGESMTRMGNAIQSLAKATSPLLASLTPEQKDRLPTLVEGLRPKRLIAHAFNLDEEQGYGRRGGGDEERGRFGLRFQQDGRQSYMRGDADQGDQMGGGMGMGRGMGSDRGMGMNHGMGMNDGMGMGGGFSSDRDGRGGMAGPDGDASGGDADY